MNNRGRSQFCPTCGKKIRYRATWENYYCEKCGKLFDTDLKEIKIYGNVNPLAALFDSNGNQYQLKVEKKETEIHQTKIFYLPDGKTTLKGDYPKLAVSPKCKYPKSRKVK